ncbi:DUF1775 domain-containing protein [Streptomyces sp. NPDC004976]
MPRRTRRHIASLVTVAAGAAGAVMLASGAAAAHVSVTGDVIPGKPATLEFRVPSELADATTVRVAVVVPPELEVTGVPAVEGWTGKKVASPADEGTQLLWTAKPGYDIPPKESGTFTVKVGPVPDRYSLDFPAEQTYSNGTIATWNQPATGSEDPDFPVPVLTVNPEAEPPPASAGGASAEAAPGKASPAPTVAATPTPSAVAAEDSGSSPGLVAGIGAAAAAAAAALAVLLRRRRSRGASHA